MARQAALIIVPILLLAGVGGYYLRQDRILVRFEAQERARALAEEVVGRVWTALHNTNATSSFEIDAAGNLLFPPPLDLAPAPQPLEVAQLTPEQRTLWQGFRADAGWLKQLGQSGAPSNFLANALFRVGMRFAEQGDPDALHAFQAIVRKFPEAVGETGLPLAPLAAMKYLDLTKGEKTKQIISWEALCAEAVAKPSPLTPVILDRAERSGAVATARMTELQATWRMHQTLRELYAHGRPQFSGPQTPVLLWITSRERRWIAATRQDGSNRWIMCHAPESLLPPGEAEAQGSAVAQRFDLQPPASAKGDLRELLRQLPPYFAVSIDVAGAALISATNLPVFAIGSKGRPASSAIVRVASITPPEVLATASRTEGGSPVIKASVHLASADALYAAQTKRLVWFGVLIAVSTLAAGLALLSLWRSFDRQLRLAELKDNFVSSVSHELRAPIASVRLMAEGLERGRVSEPEKQREYFRFIVQECQRLTALIQNVLDVSRIDLGRKRYDFELADVSRLVRETVASMQPTAQERGLQLRAPEQNSLSAVLDACAIQQALVNLIDNAVKHSPGGSAISVTAETRHDDARAWLDISVEDQGEGIPAGEHERIFERFYRVGSELRRQTPGVGIGLSIVKEIVEAHQGRVRVLSEPGKGSRFTMELPLKGGSA